MREKIDKLKKSSKINKVLHENKKEKNKKHKDNEEKSPEAVKPDVSKRIIKGKKDKKDTNKMTSIVQILFPPK